MAASIGLAGYGEFRPRSRWGLESGIPLPRPGDGDDSYEGLFRSRFSPATHQTVLGPALPARVRNSGSLPPAREWGWKASWGG
jgi:hypothetical protein